MNRKNHSQSRRGESKRLSPFLFKNQAFTLLELLIVLVLIVAVSGLTFPNLKSYYHESVTNQAVRRITDLIEYARYESVMQRKTLRLSVSDSNTVQLFVLDEKFVPHLSRFGKAYSFPDHLSLSSLSEQNIFFYPDGNTSKVHITLDKKEGGYIEISTKALFGAVQVEIV